MEEVGVAGGVGVFGILCSGGFPFGIDYGVRKADGGVDCAPFFIMLLLFICYCPVYYFCHLRGNYFYLRNVDLDFRGLAAVNEVNGLFLGGFLEESGGSLDSLHIYGGGGSSGNHCVCAVSHEFTTCPIFIKRGHPVHSVEEEQGLVVVGREIGYNYAVGGGKIARHEFPRFSVGFALIAEVADGLGGHKGE